VAVKGLPGARRGGLTFPQNTSIISCKLKIQKVVDTGIGISGVPASPPDTIIQMYSINARFKNEEHHTF